MWVTIFQSLYFALSHYRQMSLVFHQNVFTYFQRFRTARPIFRGKFRLFRLSRLHHHHMFIITSSSDHQGEYSNIIKSIGFIIPRMFCQWLFTFLIFSKFCAGGNCKTVMTPGGKSNFLSGGQRYRVPGGQIWLFFRQHLKTRWVNLH